VPGGAAYRREEAGAMSEKKLDESQMAELARLRELAAAMGSDVGGMTKMTPSVDIGEPVSEVAASMGRLLRNEAIFLRGKQVWAEDLNGELARMDSEFLCSWVERALTCTKMTMQGPKRVSMGKDLAAKVLKSTEFRSWLRPLRAIRSVRMAVLRASGDLELLPKGYDEEAQTWTMDEVDFPKEMPVVEAVRKIERWFGEWPWDDMEKSILDSGSCGAIVGAMMGQFCDAILPVGTKRPMVVVTANQAGSGKSTLVRMVLTPVNGLPGEGDLPEDKQELIKLLQAAAINRLPYLVLDDIGRFLRSPALNRFVTSARHAGRIMGGQAVFDEESMTQVCVTGNNLEITVDLARRAVVAGLFVPGEVQGRKFRCEINDSFLSREATRAEMLGACWSILRAAHAEAKGDLLSVPQGRCWLASFEEWSAVVQRCLLAARWKADPLVADRARELAATEEVEMRALLASLGERVTDEHPVARWEYGEIIEEARRLNVFEWLVGGAGEPDPKLDAKARFGLRLKQWMGRELARKSDGRVVQFGKRRTRKVRVVEVSFVD
jgi:hypothetical protein